MARAAARQQSRALDLVFGCEFAPLFDLVLRRMPLHVEHLVPRTDETLRIAVTFEAPLHLKRVHLPYQRHLIDSAVAGRAPDALIDVNAVIEINEVGQIMHPLPDDRL